MLLPGHHHRHTSSFSHHAMGSGDVFQLLLHSFFTARTKVFFFSGFFELSTTWFYICQFYGMGLADLGIKVIDLQDLLFDLMTPFFAWLTKSMTARFLRLHNYDIGQVNDLELSQLSSQVSRHQELRSSSQRPLDRWECWSLDCTCIPRCFPLVQRATCRMTFGTSVPTTEYFPINLSFLSFLLVRICPRGRLIVPH